MSPFNVEGASSDNLYMEVTLCLELETDEKTPPEVPEATDVIGGFIPVKLDLVEYEGAKPANGVDAAILAAKSPIKRSEDPKPYQVQAPSQPQQAKGNHLHNMHALKRAKQYRAESQKRLLQNQSQMQRSQLKLKIIRQTKSILSIASLTFIVGAGFKLHDHPYVTESLATVSQLLTRIGSILNI